MDKIGFLVWDIPANRPGIDGDKIVFFHKESAKRIQDDINEKGGIAGKEIFIKYLQVPAIKKDYEDITTAYDESKKVFKETLEENEEILFLRCPTTFTGSYERKLNYLEEIHSSERLLFSKEDIAGLDDSLIASNVVTTSHTASIKSKKPDGNFPLDIKYVLNKESQPDQLKKIFTPARTARSSILKFVAELNFPHTHTHIYTYICIAV